MATDKLTKKQIEMLKQKLLSEKEKLSLSNKNSVEMIPLDVEDQSDEVDMANSDYNHSHMLRMRNREIFYSKKIDNALRKIDDGSYGLCDDCGSNIKYQRLLARPSAELCIACKEESERTELGNITSKKSKSLGDIVNLAQGN